MNVCVVVFGSFVTLKILISFSRSLFFKAEGIFCMWLEIKRERERDRGTSTSSSSQGHIFAY